MQTLSKQYNTEKGPVMMQYLAIVKNSQEVASKKNSLDKDLHKTKTNGLVVERKVEITIKYVPTTLTSNPNPSYGVSAIGINKVYFE